MSWCSESNRSPIDSTATVSLTASSRSFRLRLLNPDTVTPAIPIIAPTAAATISIKALQPLQGHFSGSGLPLNIATARL